MTAPQEKAIREAHELSVSMKHSAGQWMVPGFDGYRCSEILDALLSQLAELRADAMRYRWLREQDWFSSDICVLREPKRVLTRGIGLGADCPSHHRLDAAIDAALAAKESEHG